MTLGIIGLGLIGGSMAIDLRKKNFADHFIGYDNSELNGMTAQRIGLVDEILPLDELIAKSDLIILSVPVSAAIRMLSDILDKINDNQYVVDVCSTKEKLNDSVHYHPRRKNYVASHPMAGTEFNGPWAAIPNLFAGRAGIICNAEDSDAKAVELVRNMYDSLNMRIIYMRAAHHDVHVAYVSHISHVISFALALTVLDKEKNEKNIFDLASGGFASTARLSKSNADMWVPIFMQNKENVLSVLDAYMDKLSQFKTAMEQNDEQALRNLIEDANRIKRILR
ncbi:MAG: prephenate dehydrogenase [Paludibacteraceae bacterium]|nr:prephenate dehydrogenase [Paludibacteraceae bacterium]MBR2261014.1 prephenate dehydrogenase [Paludibacteraceae bacterium]MEE3482873.1 prephenate dehydrogenase [Bacteroidales bacterium]